MKQGSGNPQGDEKRPERQPEKLILVEGKDDLYSLVNLLNSHSISIRFNELGGDRELLEAFELRLSLTEQTHLGLVIDADGHLTETTNSAQNRWNAARNLLAKEGYQNLPLNPVQGGTIIAQPGKKRIGVWIMPNNSLPGMLEDFIRFLVPKSDAIWQKVESCVNEIPDKETRFASVPLAKVHLHTWLAWQEKPGTPIGQAITARYLDTNVPEALEFVQWVKTLFELP